MGDVEFCARGRLEPFSIGGLEQEERKRTGERERELDFEKQLLWTAAHGGPLRCFSVAPPFGPMCTVSRIRGFENEASQKLIL